MTRALVGTDPYSARPNLPVLPGSRTEETEEDQQAWVELDSLLARPATSGDQKPLPAVRPGAPGAPWDVLDDLIKHGVPEEPLKDREAEAIRLTREDELFRSARETEIATGELTNAPMRRYNQIRREQGLPVAETLPDELIDGRLLNAVKQSIRGFAETANRAIEGVGDTIDALMELVDIEFDAPTDFFEASRNVIRAYLPDDPRLREEFFASQLPQGLGSTLGFATLGLTGGAPGLVGAGVSVGAAELAEQGRTAEASKKEAAVATLLGGALGVTETALPLRFLRALKPFNKLIGGRFFGRILDRGGLTVDVAIETAQEAGQELGSNVIARRILKQNDDLFEGVRESGQVGAGVGFIFGILRKLAGIRGPRMKSPEAQKGAEQGERIAEQVQEQADEVREARRTERAEPPALRELPELRETPRETGAPREEAITRQVQEKQQALLKDYDERVAAGQEDPTPNQASFTEAGYGQMTRKERAAEIERLRSIRPIGVADEVQVQRNRSNAEQTLRTASVDPPGVAPDQVEVMGMPGSISPPPGAPAAPQGDMPTRLDRPVGMEESVSAPEVINALAAIPVAFGRNVPIRIGRLMLRGREEFKVQPEVVRIRTANDIRSAAHGLGHAIDHLTVKGRFKNNLRGELQALGEALYDETVPAAGYAREGFAEFIYLWVTQPKKAKKAAPKTLRWFETEFLAEHPGVREAFQNARNKAFIWAEQGSFLRIEQSMVDVGSLRERLKGVAKTLQKATSIKTHIEALQPLNLFAREFEARTGRTLSAAENPFTFSQAVRLAHDARLAYMIERGMIDSAGNKVGGSLNEAFAPVRDRWREFVVYLYAKRAQALWNQKKEITTPEGGTELIAIPRNPGISAQDADKIAAQLGTEDFALAAQKYYDWNDGVLNYAAELSPTFALAKQRIDEVDPGYYIPLQREMDELDTFSGSQGLVTAGTLSKRLRGSGRRIQHPITRTVANADRILLNAHRRYVLEQIIRLSKEAGMGHLVEEVPRLRVPLLTRKITDVIRSVNAKLATDQRLPIPDVVEETVTFFAPETRAPNGEPIIPFKNEDRLEFYQVDPDLLEATMGLEHFSVRNIPVFGAIMEWTLAKPRRIFVTGTTGLRMSFGLVTNPQRDAPPQTMYVNSRANANGAQVFYAWFRSMFSVLRPGGAKADPYFDAFLRLGVQSGQVLAQDIRRARRSARRVRQTATRRIFDVRTPFEAIQGLIQRIESGPRLAELRMIAKDVGWKPGEPISLDQATEMLLAAKQVTTDFSSAGTFSRAANQMIPFYAAAISGPRANLRAMRRNPRKMVTRALLGLTIPTLLQWWWYKDEEWYKELPWRQKYLFWYIPVGKDRLLRIPRAFEIGMVFASMPEALIDSWYREDPEGVKEWFRTAYATLLPDLMPVLPREILAQKSNWDKFWERPVVPRRLIDKPPDEQFTPFTSRLAITLSKIYPKISPIRLDHAIRGVGGGVASDLIETLGLGPSGIDRESEAADLPIIGRMFRRGGKLGGQARSIDDVYDALDEAYTIQASDRIEETRALRSRRLMLEDAARTISNLMVVRSLEPSVKRRGELFREALDIAQEALTAIKTDAIRARKFQRRRNVSDYERKRVLKAFEKIQG